ncbi:hypothetical protein Smic_32300 [Streptomyces microflavus]|uniref:Uncharacterized protein n=1 Tax=Streptomyces microflavus TaxID=1919 RepID=A0A7J0CRX0_STRMI|nr:hypothetical protein Smic_32300 [Streptomyces microflavus]
MHEYGEGSGGQLGGGMAVGLGRALDGQLEHELRLPPHEQPERRGPGDRARVPGGGFFGRSSVPMTLSPNPPRHSRVGPRRA